PPPIPIVTGLSPLRGPAGGGTPIVITGINLPTSGSPPPFRLGGIGFGVGAITGSEVNAFTPANSAGVKQLEVRTSLVFPYSYSNTGFTFEYFAPPSISNIYPKKGEIGTEVIIEGANFANDCIIKFNDIIATNTTVVSNKITCKIPPGV